MLSVGSTNVNPRNGPMQLEKCACSDCTRLTRNPAFFACVSTIDTVGSRPPGKISVKMNLTKRPTSNVSSASKADGFRGARTLIAVGSETVSSSKGMRVPQNELVFGDYNGWTSAWTINSRHLTECKRR